MKRYILTGAPGAGKTAIIRWLEARGWPVVEEAATDVIALEHAQGNPEPEACPDFIDAIVALQTARRTRADGLPGAVQFHDRSPICTYALSLFLGYPVSPDLAGELERIRSGSIYERKVFFIQSLGFITPTRARRITFEDAIRFERVHEEVYRDLGYDCVSIGPGNLVQRGRAIEERVTTPP